MLKEAPGMHDVERIAGELLGEQVQLPRFEIRLIKCHDETRIQIDRQHRTARCDTSGEPLRHRAAARPDVEHPHTVGDIELFEYPYRERVPILLVDLESLPLALPTHVEDVARLRGAHAGHATTRTWPPEAEKGTHQRRPAGGTSVPEAGFPVLAFVAFHVGPLPRGVVVRHLRAGT